MAAADLPGNVVYQVIQRQIFIWCFEQALRLQGLWPQRFFVGWGGCGLWLFMWDGSCWWWTALPPPLNPWCHSFVDAEDAVVERVADEDSAVGGDADAVRLIQFGV